MSPALAARLGSHQPTSGCMGPVIQHRWPWPISGPCRGLPQQSWFTVYIFISAPTPWVASLFVFLQLSFFSFFLSLNPYFFYSSPSVAIVYLALTTPRPSPYTHTSLIQEMKTECRRKEEEERQVVRALEEEKEGLTSRCAALRADLEEKERQASSQRDQRDAAQARVKVWTRGQVHSDTCTHTQSCTGRAPSSRFSFLLHTLNSLIPHTLSSSACEYKKISAAKHTI